MERHCCVPECSTDLGYGKRYLMRDKQPYCVPCFEKAFCHFCKRCYRLIEASSKDVSYKEDHFHEQCFICDECNESLVRKTFAYLGDQQKYVCSECWAVVYAKRCDKCQEVITPGSKKVEYRGQTFHDGCFACKLCKDPIGRQPFVNRQDSLYCQVCFENSIAERCYACQQTIGSDGLRYRGHPWHKNCFKCAGCSKHLSGQQFTSNNQQPYCPDCYLETFAKMCTGCKRLINTLEGDKMVSFDDNTWHMQCFVCWACNDDLGGCENGFVMHEQHLYCPNCAIELEDDF